MLLKVLFDREKKTGTANQQRSHTQSIILCECNRMQRTMMQVTTTTTAVAVVAAAAANKTEIAIDR